MNKNWVQFHRRYIFFTTSYLMKLADGISTNHAHTRSYDWNDNFNGRAERELEHHVENIKNIEYKIVLVGEEVDASTP